MKKKVARTIIDSLEEEDSPREWRERRNSELEDIETDPAEEYALTKWTENVTRSEAISTQETIEDLIDQQNKFTNELINELEKRGVENEYIAAQNNRNNKRVKEESEYLKEGQEGLTDDHSELSEDHDKILTATRRNLIVGTAAAAGGGAIGGAYGGFGGGLLGSILPGFFGSEGTEKETEYGVLTQEEFGIAWEEMNNLKYGNLFSQDAYENLTDGEGTELALLDVEIGPDDSSFSVYQIESEEVDDDWKGLESVDKLLDNYGEEVDIGTGEFRDEALAEYLLEVSKSENPENIEFNDYLGA